MKPHTNFIDEIHGDIGQANFGTFLWQMLAIAVLIAVFVKLFY